MDADTYITERVDHQLNWYETKSIKNKRSFLAIKTFEIIGSASIPFLVAFIETGGDRIAILVGFIGLMLAIAAGVSSIFSYHQNWLNFRSIAELLKHEKYRFLTSTPPYDQETRFQLFVDAVESAVSAEHSGWREYQCTQRKENDDG